MPRPGQSGMTLLEMLVGITLLALMVLALTQAEVLVLGAWREGDRQASLQEDLSYCQRLMLTQVRSATSFKPPSVKSGAASFAGGPQSLSLVTAASLEGFRPGLWLVTYSLVEGPDGEGWLVAQQSPALNPAVWSGAAPAAEGLTLLSGVSRLAFSYHSVDEATGRAVTASAWRDPHSRRLPLAVELEMVVRGRRVSWRLALPVGREG
jgi:prepilin-type N-terminal cleavage/methylation domain-containing protein